jgi:fibronectin-binding autotransporter adhesin
MNQNFDEVELKALNRAAPVLQATLDLDVTATYDLGTSAHKFRDLWLSRNASIGGTLGVTGAATFSSTVATGALTVTGTASATTFSGSGASLTSVPAASLTGANTLPDAVLSTNVPLKNAANAFTGSIQFTSSVTFPGAGSISKHASNGLFIAGVAGSSFDFVITNPSGATAAIYVPTGTVNVGFGGTLVGTSNGRSIIGAGTAGSSTALRVDGGTGAGSGSYISFAKAATDQASVGMESALIGSGTSNNLVLFPAAGNAINFYTNGSTSIRWGINTAGDFTFGASSHIFASNGTPSCTGCAGTDYAFTGTQSGAGAVTVTFGHTFSTTPVCIATHNGSANALFTTAVSTTGVTFTPSGVTAASAFYAHCFGY